MTPNWRNGTLIFVWSIGLKSTLLLWIYGATYPKQTNHRKLLAQYIFFKRPSVITFNDKTCWKCWHIPSFFIRLAIDQNDSAPSKEIFWGTSGLNTINLSTFIVKILKCQKEKFVLTLVSRLWFVRKFTEYKNKKNY